MTCLEPGEHPSVFCQTDRHDECARRGFRFCTCHCHLQPTCEGMGDPLGEF